jgi:hypothetical protein
MTRDDKFGLLIRLGLIALIYILAGFIEPCDNEPSCHAPQEFKHD